MLHDYCQGCQWHGRFFATEQLKFQQDIVAEKRLYGKVSNFNQFKMSEETQYNNIHKVMALHR
jgi:hypothetical protein